MMFINKITKKEGLQLPTGSAVMSGLPGPEVATTSGTGVSKSPIDETAECVDVAADMNADAEGW